MSKLARPSSRQLGYRNMGFSRGEKISLALECYRSPRQSHVGATGSSGSVSDRLVPLPNQKSIERRPTVRGGQEADTIEPSIDAVPPQ